MSQLDEMIVLLKKLRLSGVLNTLELRTRQAVDDNLAHSDFLFRLLLDEVERRDAGQLEQRVRRASFEHQKTFDDFDFSFTPKIPKARITDRATCAIVQSPCRIRPGRPTCCANSLSMWIGLKSPEAPA